MFSLGPGQGRAARDRDSDNRVYMAGDALSDAPAVGGYQPTADELLQATREAKSQNPDFGVKRIWTLLKEKGWVISEQRVKKVMQENGLSENSSANGPATTNGTDKAKQGQLETPSVS